MKSMKSMKSVIHANHRPISRAKWCNDPGPSVPISEFASQVPHGIRCPMCVQRLIAAGRYPKDMGGKTGLRNG
jgi:hypothetical protein